MDVPKITSIAQFLIQVSITVLPIGVGASSYVAQQKSSTPVMISLGIIWFGLVVFAASVFLNLGVIRTTDVKTSSERKSFETKFQAGISTFVIGTICLVASPAGFATNQLFTPKKIMLESSSEVVEFSIESQNPIDNIVFVSAKDLSLKEFPALRIDTTVTDSSCITVRKISEEPPVYDEDTWLTVWKISAKPSCMEGNYSILFKILAGREFRGQVQLVVRIVH